MAGMLWSIQNVLKFISYITPFLVAFLLINIGFLNNEPLKSIVYIAGVSIACLIGLLLQNTLKVTGKFPQSATCSIFSLPGDQFIVPSLSTLFLSFSIFYLFFPMLSSNNLNWPLLLLLLVLFTFDTSFRVFGSNCTNLLGAGFGVLLGAILSMGYYAIIKATQPDLLYFINSRLSNNVECSKPSKQTFKCSVYKNGQLIKNL